MAQVLFDLCPWSDVDAINLGLLASWWLPSRVVTESINPAMKTKVTNAQTIQVRHVVVMANFLAWEEQQGMRFESGVVTMINASGKKGLEI